MIEGVLASTANTMRALSAALCSVLVLSACQHPPAEAPEAHAHRDDGRCGYAIAQQKLERKRARCAALQERRERNGGKPLKMPECDDDDD